MEGGSVGRTTSELPFHRRKRRRVVRDMKICRPRWGEKKGDEDFFPFPPLRDILLLFFKGIRTPPLSPSGDLTREEVFGLGDNWLPRQTEFDFQVSKSFFPIFSPFLETPPLSQMFWFIPPHPPLYRKFKRAKTTFAASSLYAFVKAAVSNARGVAEVIAVDYM